MNLNDMIKGICKLQLNSISDVDNDPLLIKLTFSILDFNVSGNKQIVPKELAIEASPSLKGKPLLCMYSPITNPDKPNDHFGDHGEVIKTDRYGNEYIGTNSIAIGTALEGGYFKTIDGIDMLFADFYCWKDRNVEILQLINEIYENGLPLFSSCEYYFKNYEINNGIQTIKSPLIFSGHLILDSGENDSKVIAPAYDSSKLISINERWNKAVAQAIKQNNQQTSRNENVDNINNNQKEVENVAENLLYKALNELSHGDIRSQIMTALSKTMTADEFTYVYVSSWGVYDNYFIYENYENSTYVNYKVPYTKTETEVIIDLASKAQVERDVVWVEVGVMQSSVNELNVKITDLTTQLNTANETINTLTSEKANIEKQFNDASDKITSLNSQVEEMKPIVEQHNTEIKEKAINAKRDYYTLKFKAVNAMDKFESKDVQELIKNSINENDEGKNAILSLNTMLVDMVQIKSDDKPMVKEVASKQENLIPTSVDFDSRYSV
jgi:hypothetical protein